MSLFILHKTSTLGKSADSVVFVKRVNSFYILPIHEKYEATNEKFARIYNPTDWSDHTKDLNV